jgi:hypothetical protein
MRMDFKEFKSSGMIPNITICGLNDPYRNKLTIGDYKYVLRREVPNPCEACIKKWNSDYDSDKSQKAAYGKLRELIHKVVSGQYGRR